MARVADSGFSRAAHARQAQSEVMMFGQGRYFELWDKGVFSAKLSNALAGGSTPPPGMEGFSL
jgi:DNA-binding transcriptional regulator/RsmH inhibitor MraZ